MYMNGKSLVLGGLLLVATGGAAMAQAPCQVATLATYQMIGSCTVGDKTFSNFTITPVSASGVIVTPVPSATVGGNPAVGLAFALNFTAPPGSNADISFNFTVLSGSTATILGAQLSITGLGSYCDNETMGYSGQGPLNLFVGTIANFGGSIDCTKSSDMTMSSPAKKMIVASDDVFIEAGSTVNTIIKLFVEPTTTCTDDDCNNNNNCTTNCNNDSEEPGSVIVFPKFVRGLVTVDGVSTPATEIEVGVVCPSGATCAENQTVKIRFSWVCGAQDGVNSQICLQNNFDVVTTVNAKAVFDPENLTITGSTGHTVAVPPCTMGYLIGYVVTMDGETPIKFDGLVGDEVIRESGAAVSAFNGNAIQAADKTAATGTPITFGNSILNTPALAFDGQAGHYAAVTNTIIGDVKFTNLTASPVFPIVSEGFLTLMTLDVLSDFPNNPVIVEFDFWNENEKLLSTRAEFICWAEYPLTMIDPNLTQTQMGTQKGVFRSTAATKVGVNGATDTIGPVTLLGFVEELEGTPLSSRTYFYPTYNNSDPVPTVFQTDGTRLEQPLAPNVSGNATGHSDEPGQSLP